MDFMKWSQSYWEEAARVQERMDLLRQEPETQDRQAARSRRRRLALLYAMYLECRQTARLLERRGKQERRGQRWKGAC